MRSAASRLPVGIVIGFVLAPVAEENLAAGLMISGGSYWPLVTHTSNIRLDRA